MLRKLLLAGAVLSLACAAQAEPYGEQIPGAGAEPPPTPAPRARLFISPSGEPFRMHDGLGAWFVQADTDADGALSADEFRADAQRFFKLLDTDHDGVVSGIEIQAYEHERVPEITALSMEGYGFGGEGRRKKRKSPPQEFDLTPRAGRHGAAQFSLLDEPQPVSHADTNIDGRVSTEEWSAITDRRFEVLDKAKAGKLTLDALRPQPPKKR